MLGVGGQRRDTRSDDRIDVGLVASSVDEHIEPERGTARPLPELDGFSTLQRACPIHDESHAGGAIERPEQERSWATILTDHGRKRGRELLHDRRGARCDHEREATARAIDGADEVVA